MQDISSQAIQGVVFSEDRKEILLIKRRDIPVWVLPGGGLDPGETPEHGVIREILEETGCSVQILRKVGEYLPVNQMTKFTHLFECQVLEGTPQPTDESSESRFFPLTNLPLMPPPYRSWIQDAEKNLPDLIRKKIAGVNYFVLLKLFLMHPILTGKYIKQLIIKIFKRF